MGIYLETLNGIRICIKMRLLFQGIDTGIYAKVILCASSKIY